MFNCDCRILICTLTVHFIHSIFDFNCHVYFVWQGWINVTKRLRGDDNVDGTCIPQVQLLFIKLPVMSVFLKWHISFKLVDLHVGFVVFLLQILKWIIERYVCVV